MRFKDINSKKINESKELLSKLEDKKSDLESALDQARQKTKEIKYHEPHVEIISKLRSIAEEVGVELDEYQERQVYQAKNNLESAIYELEEVFKDAIRDISNKIDDVEYELEYGE